MNYPNPHLVCADGFRISVQADPRLWCTYGEDGFVTEVEIACKNSIQDHKWRKEHDQGGFPKSSELRGWRVYGHVPIEVVKQVIENHGGAVENFEYLPWEQEAAERAARQWEACLGVPL